MSVHNYLAIYAVKHKDAEVVKCSRSGGIFTAISDWIIENKGVVYGCILSDNLRVMHIRATTKKERDFMRGSKYVQSTLGDTFTAVKADLESGIWVLFSGTMCQVEGLYRYLGQRYKNLICVDILCHGVPSPKVYQKYVRWQEERKKGICTAIDFRNKRKYGWRDHVETLSMIKDNGKVKLVDSYVYSSIFYRHVSLRESCFKCPFKSLKHSADITIADCWGIEGVSKEFDDNKGTSLVMLNSEQGKWVINQVVAQINMIQCNIEKCMQKPFLEPCNRPVDKDLFWMQLYAEGFDKIALKYGSFNLKAKIFDVVQRK